MMNENKFILAGVGMLVLQVLLADLISIRLIRPDFILVFILYLSIWRGRSTGMLAGFGLGLVIDLIGTASYFGISSLCYIIFAYLTGSLKGKYSKWPPLAFHFTWAVILVGQFALRFLITNYDLFLYQNGVFWGTVSLASGYTLVLAIASNFFISLGVEE